MKHATDITVVLDRSGSMEQIKSDAIGAFNEFLSDQKHRPGECHLALVQFDHEYEVVYGGQPIANVPRLTTETYKPRGSTALLDAIGRTIDATGARLSALSEAERPDQVVLVILTDGLENASTDYSRERVFAMIQTQRDIYGWTFLFLAANQDAIAVGGAMGIGAAHSLDFQATGGGVRAAVRSLSRAVSDLRATGSAQFTDEDRQEARSSSPSGKKRKVH
jgi:Mg-chelatase subunit ChlD